MKKLLLTFFATLTLLSAHAQTATNFNCNDCAGNNHDLFAELNAGKVIVIEWAMPCGVCVGPALTAYYVVQGYAASNPGQVVFYVADDYANTSCATMNNFVNNNGMSGTTTFSDTSISMSDYGSPGMPKVIVLGGGSAHTVFFNENDSAANNNAALQAAIDAALLTSVNSSATLAAQENLFPNPSVDRAVISLSRKQADEVQIDLLDQLGRNVMSVFSGTLAPGENKIPFSVAGLPNGAYLLRTRDASGSRLLKMIVAR